VLVPTTTRKFTLPLHKVGIDVKATAQLADVIARGFWRASAQAFLALPAAGAALKRSLPKTRPPLMAHANSERLSAAGSGWTSANHGQDDQAAYAGGSTSTLNAKSLALTLLLLAALFGSGYGITVFTASRIVDTETSRIARAWIDLLLMGDNDLRDILYGRGHPVLLLPRPAPDRS
jgi:hypothetical protein